MWRLIWARLTAAGKGFPVFTLHTPTRPLRLPNPKDNGIYGPLGLDIIILFIVVDNSSFPCNIFKRQIGHLARINWGEWSWKGTCKRQLDRQTTQWINFNPRRDIKYTKVFNTCGHTYLTCRLYYQRIISKYKCLSSLFFSFFLL